MTAHRSPASIVVTSKREDVPEPCHIHKETCFAEPSLTTPTDRTTSFFVSWVALVLGFTPDPCRFRGNVQVLIVVLGRRCRLLDIFEQTLPHKAAKVWHSFGNFGCVLVEADGFVCPHVSSHGQRVYVCMHTYVVRRPVGPGNLQRIERSVRL